MKKLWIFLFALLLPLVGHAANDMIKGFNLTELPPFLFDASDTEKTPAQLAVDNAKRLGANHIILNVRALMQGAHANEVVPLTQPADRANERLRISRLVKYIRAQGMTVGLRPIFFVVGPNGEFPYKEKQPDGKYIVWWHGNIQPSDPNRWFESFRVYLDTYLPLAQVLNIDEFTIGAELYSMTVGVEDQWKEYPYGFPGRWLQLLRYVRAKLPNARLMYDINFTDDDVKVNGMTSTGGEFERWRYRLVDLANRPHATDVDKEIWNDLVNFWKELDGIGIDVYRSLADAGQKVPTNYDKLVETLRQRTDNFATQMDNSISQISMVTGVEKPVVFKELGFRSVDNGFIDPFTYAGAGTPNAKHQAAALQAYFSSFWDARWPWFKGFNLWEISLDPAKQGPKDNGFSPVGKKESEDLLKKYFN